MSRTYPDSDRGLGFPRERTEEARDGIFKPSADGDQIDAAFGGDDLSPRAHDVPVLGAILAEMAAAEPNPFDVAVDPGFLPGIGISAANSSVSAGAGHELFEGVRFSELRNLHDAAQLVATEAVFGTEYVQLSTFAELLFVASLGWTGVTVAQVLLAQRHGHQCSVCECRRRPRAGAIGAVAVSAGSSLRVITVCEQCRDDIAFEYPGADFVYPKD